jgi:hypothetical protein
MKKSNKVLLGIATIWPVVYIFLFVAAILLMVLFIPNGSGAPGRGPGFSGLVPAAFVGFLALHMLTIFGSFALTVFYIIRVFKTERLDQNLKIAWMLLLFFAGMLAQPVFWYLYIWRETPASQSQPQLGPGLKSTWSRKTSAPEREPTYIPPPQPPDWR